MRGFIVGIVEVLFVVGAVGSAVVILLTFFEDLKTLFRDSD